MSSSEVPSEDLVGAIVDYFDRVDRSIYPVPPEIMDYLKINSTLDRLPDRTIASLYRLGALQSITNTVFSVGEIDSQFRQDIGFSVTSHLIEEYCWLSKVDVGREFKIRMMEAYGIFLRKFQDQVDKTIGLDVALEVLLETYIHQYGSLVAAQGNELWLEIVGLDDLFEFCLDHDVNVVMVSDDTIWDSDEETPVGYGINTISDDGTVRFFLYKEKEGESLETEFLSITEPPVIYFKARFA